MFSEFELALAGAIDPPQSQSRPERADEYENDRQSFKRPRAPQRKQSDFVMTSAPSFSNSAFSNSASRMDSNVVQQSIQVDDEDDNNQLEERIRKLDADQRPIQSGPVKKRPSAHKIPTIEHSLHAAANTLLEHQQIGTVNLGMGALQEIEELTRCNDEFTKVDPFICISDTLFTGTCNIMLYETVRVSVFILACHLGCQYTVSAVEGATSTPKSFRKVAVNAMTGSALEEQLLQGAQTFDCERRVHEKLLERCEGNQDIVDLQLLYVDYHMMTLGPMSSEDAAGAGFIEDESRIFGSVLANERISQEGGGLMGSQGDFADD